MTIICRLVYRAGNICNHFFTRDFLQVRSTWKTNERETFAASVCWARKAASPPRGKEEDFFHGPRNWKHCQVGSSRNTTPLQICTFLGQANREQRDQAWEVCLWRLWVLGEVCCLGMSQVELNASVVVYIVLKVETLHNRLFKLIWWWYGMRKPW